MTIIYAVPFGRLATFYIIEIPGSNLALRITVFRNGTYQYSVG